MILTPWSGTVWRIMWANAADPLTPVQSPEGRFHHSGQTAIYTSLSAEGAGVAIKRYLRPNDPPRVIAAIEVQATRILDLRQPDALPDHIPTNASVVWQDVRATGAAAPTWAISDAARAGGAQGVLYASRSRPDLTHLTIFDLSDQTGVTICAKNMGNWP